MKNIKKLMAIALVAMMFAAMTVPAMAEGSKASITITNALEGADYSAYRLLDTTVALIAPGCHSGDAEHQSTCYTIAYTVNPTYENILYEITKTDEGRALITYINGMSDADVIEFSEDVYEAVKYMDADATTKGEKTDSGVTAVFSNIDSGYWLIVETGKSPNAAYSRIMLDTSGTRNISIKSKRQQPTLEKTVGDNGVNHGAGADVAIGDKVEFLLKAYIPDPTGYDSYTYIIHDTMEKGLSYDSTSFDVAINEYNSTNKLSTNYYTVIEGKDEYNNTTTLTITVKIIEAIEAKVLKPTNKLYITYKAVLNEKCNVFEPGANTDYANFNTAYLEYSNKPYDASSKAETEPSTAYVWTFPLTLKKVDGNDKILNGAKFVVSKEGDHELGINKSIDAHKDHLIAFIKEDNNYRVAPGSYTGEKVYEIEAGTAVLQGFNDQIDYYIYEITNPAGYKPLSGPVHVKFFADYEGGSPYFLAGSPNVSVSNGIGSTELVAKIVNSTGAELPSTGGIGTTIFYILGGVLAAGAVVFLITNKRVDDKR